ncbi:MAG: CoA transferase [Pseudomonadota bacterium]|nr:CoA transferase [Pseudomonadota bacterium]QKK04805.1 MAG: CoA transferase [Pseudomonadota bacterium]
MTQSDIQPSALQPSSLAGLRILDMSRILAGPSATQLLGDLGADVVKIERPAAGDDTRKWGPPFVKDADGNNTSESSYYLSANRNKRSIAIDYTQPEGRDLLLKLMEKADVLIENYRTGTLARYGLGYEDVKEKFPGLIYCSLTGFGQTGPYRDKSGYDFLIQGMGGIMSLTGPEQEGGTPYKTGVAIADLMAGMYAATGILAALHYRDKTGRGQFVDVALLDTQVAWLSNAAQYYLTGGKVTPRMGNAHPTIVPYEVFPAADGHMILAIGNDKQFSAFCNFAKCTELAEDSRFKTNQARVENRKILVPMLRDITKQHPQQFWIENLEKIDVPCGPVNNLEQVFENPQVLARDMVIKMKHPLSSETVKLLGCPLKLSETPAKYRHAPPFLDQHHDDILRDWLGEDNVHNIRPKGGPA